METHNKDILLLIRQFLAEEKYTETIHELEKKTACFFDMKYLENCITKGEWEKGESYVSSFTKIGDNEYSTKLFFYMRQQKYFEALDGGESAKAVEILQNELNFAETCYPAIHRDLTLLLSKKNIREGKDMSWYVDTETSRAILCRVLGKLILSNPDIKDKLCLPKFSQHRLQELIMQSLKWQHHLCKNPKPSHPVIETILTDHTCNIQQPEYDFSTYSRE